VLSTGRSRFTAEPIAAQLGIPPGYLVASNGAVVMHLATREVLSRRCLPIPVALEIVRTIFRAGAAPYVFEDGTGEGVEAARVLHPPDIRVPRWADRPRYRPHSGLADALPFAPVSVNTYGPPEIVRPLVSRLRGNLPGDVCIIESGTEQDWGAEVFLHGVSKRAGLETVAERLRVPREEAMAIGDHINDIEMIAWAGFGVAMGNAIPEVRSIADWVTAPVAEDGVALAIERFVLRGPGPTAAA
jgi:hydroxymethylpyrimidine pyrophosphatase-like HAD family hydrolase